MIKPAPKGSGIIAGGATRMILELAGLPNASSKMLGKTTNKLTNVLATFKALELFLPKAVTEAKEREAQDRKKNIKPVTVVKKEEKTTGEVKTKPVVKKTVIKKSVVKKTATKAEEKKS